jgi:flagellar hook assembly protein FlgD
LVERRLSLEAHPNPFSDRVSLRLTAVGLRPEVRIYDVNGAVVRAFPEIKDSPQRDGPRFLTWDGTDSHGHPAPNGVYLVRVSDGSGRVATRELILARE